MSASFYTPEEAAEVLAVSTKTLYRWTSQDPTLPHFKRGNVLRYPREEFLAWIKRQMPRASRRGPQAPAQATSTAA